jgi:hypothetical protein
MKRNIYAILILLSFLLGFGAARITQEPRMRHSFYSQIIFCGPAGNTNTDLAPRLESRLESGGFRKIPTGPPGPNADPLSFIMATSEDGREGVPMTVWQSNLQSYFNWHGDIARLTCGQVQQSGVAYLELELLPGGPKGGYDEKLENLPLAMKLREDILRELAKANTSK